MPIRESAAGVKLSETWYYYHYAGIDGDKQGIWNTIDFPGGGDDAFGTISVADIASAKTSMDFIFPLSDALTLTLGGKAVTLYGWRVDTGLYGRFGLLSGLPSRIIPIP
jgi:hypothetical protein